VIQGWGEGVPHMTVGSIYEFAIPANLAYGERDLGSIPPGSTLIFKIQLLEAKTPA
jgi:FKBP-type peptidyl-prolyl cis-trans isomerase FkpA